MVAQINTGISLYVISSGILLPRCAAYILLLHFMIARKNGETQKSITLIVYYVYVKIL